jgi:hypothetical protein
MQSDSSGLWGGFNTFEASSAIASTDAARPPSPLRGEEKEMSEEWGNWETHAKSPLQGAVHDPKSNASLIKEAGLCSVLLLDDPDVDSAWPIFLNYSRRLAHTLLYLKNDAMAVNLRRPGTAQCSGCHLTHRWHL